MSEYTKKTTTKNDGSESIRYRLDGKLVAAAEVPEAVVNSLGNLADDEAVDQDGAVVKNTDSAPTTEDTKTGDKEETKTEGQDSPSEEPTDPDDIDDESGLDVEEQARAERLRAGIEADGDEGMGFPMKNGKTVDIFDKKTPHTHIRLVQGVVVPLSEENFNNKSDGEIIAKLEKMGKL